jgi:7-cyano-7-deazaguanine synthase
MTDQALVVLSGGQDSTTCLYWALRRFGNGNVSSITFDYCQRHRIEIDCAERVAERAGVENRLLPIDTFAALGGNALTGSVEVPVAESADGALPVTFVPGRNLVFLTFAAAFAWQRNIDHLVTGVAQTDYSGYPDCREDTLVALQTALRLGMESQIELHMPLMQLSKKQTVLLARELGMIDALVDTHSCYNGLRPPCGGCAACRLRARGFDEAGIPDPLLAV